MEGSQDFGTFISNDDHVGFTNASVVFDVQARFEFDNHSGQQNVVGSRVQSGPRDMLGRAKARAVSGRMAKGRTESVRFKNVASGAVDIGRARTRLHAGESRPASREHSGK